MKRPALIIFDFDGTIANTVTPGLVYANEILMEMGRNPITHEDFQLLRNKSTRDVLKYFKLSLLEIPSLALRLRKRVRQNIAEMKPYPAMPFVLDELKKRGYDLEILTSNAKDLVLQFLNNNNLTQFNTITSERDLFGKHISLGKLMKRYKLNPEDCIYLGDEVRDVEACKKAHIPIISVTWGLQAEEILKIAGCTYVAEKPEDILEILPS